MPEADEGAIGVLVMAYGTPAHPDDIEAYYTHLRRGRPPTPEQLDNLVCRYEAIGGTSPLLERTRAQVAGIALALGPGYAVEMGMKHAAPFLEDGVAALARTGVRAIVGVVLAPHFSALSVGEYQQRLIAAADAAGLPAACVDSWHLAPAYLDLLAESLAAALAKVGGAAEVVFTAHSLPARILDTDDPYPTQLAETAEAVAHRAGIADWRVAWQSAGRTPEPWIGPDVLDVLRELSTTGTEAVVVCPAGFVSDHLEVLYDLDIEAQALADAVGLRFARTASPNDHPALCESVASAVAEVARSTDE